MANIYSIDLLTLIELCSEKELNTNLQILRSNLDCTDYNVSWLPLISNQFETYSDITALNLYEKISMLVEIRKLLPKILVLNSELTRSIKSTENLCRNYKINFNKNLTQNMLAHKSSCQSCGLIEEENGGGELDELFEKIYPRRIVDFVCAHDKCHVSTVRLRPDGMIECLLCNNYMIHQEYLIHMKDHICGNEHLRNVLKEKYNLAKFHKFWQQQKPETWKSHFQFEYASDHLRCALCKNNVNYEDVLAHLVGCSDNLPEELPRGPYPMAVEKILFGDVPFIQLGENFYPVFQRRWKGTSKDVRCLICNETVNGDQQDHLESPEHTALQNLERVQVSLRLYHDVWSSLPESLQKWQTYFIRRPETMTCTMCESPMDYDVDAVRKHVSTDHLKCTDFKRTRDLESNKQEGTKKANHVSHEMRFLYKDVPSIKVDGHPYPMYQRSCTASGSNEYFCMICNETVGSHADRDRHEKAVTHVLWQDERIVQESLARFHKVWGELPEPMRRNQSQFERRPDKMKCKTCQDKFVDYDADSVRKHLRTEPHFNKTRTKCKRRMLRDNVTEGSSTDKNTKITQLPKSPVPSVSSSVIVIDSPQQEENGLSVISDSEEPVSIESDHQPFGKKIKIEALSAGRTINHDQEKRTPANVHYDYKTPDFIPLTKTCPEDVTAEFATKEMTTKTEPGCSYTYANCWQT